MWFNGGTVKAELNTGGTTFDIGAYSNHNIRFVTNNTAKAQLTTSANFGLGSNLTSFGTNADTVFGIFNGTAPTTSPSDMIQIYSKDITAGNAAFHLRIEDGSIIKLYKQTLTNSTGGTASGDLEDVASAGLADPAKINNNFTEIYTILNNLGLA